MEFASGNIFLRPNNLAKAGDECVGHKHNFDHTTFVVAGKVHVRGETPDGRVIEQDFEAGEHFLVKKDVHHTITALVDGTRFTCIYSHRNGQGDVVQTFEGWTSAYV